MTNVFPRPGSFSLTEVSEKESQEEIKLANEAVQARIDKEGKKYPNLKARLDDKEGTLSEKVKDVTRSAMKPLFVEFFASFSKYGLGTPTGVANYTGGKYVLNVSGVAGDTFVTVTGGNIADAGATAKWACVIKNDDGIFDGNRVMGTDGVNKVNLLKPLKKSITSGLLGNLHDMNLGQHYTELGYYAFIQHLYFANPRYSERNNVIAQFLEDDTAGKWVTSGFTSYNLASSVVTPDDSFRAIGGKIMSINLVDATNYAEWQENVNGNKGYLEAFVGCSVGSVRADFYLDGVLVDSKTVNREVERIIFPYEYAKTAKIKIVGLGGYPQSLLIGRVTWFINEKYAKSRLIQPDMKVVYMGDSWGEFHTKAVTRELDRLMKADGGKPTLWNYSKGGHTSTYAMVWFDEYVIKNKPDVVIIEYFTNDFNSIGGVNVGTFLNPSGVQQDMNIANLSQYISNMQYMIDKAIENGIQPIIVMPSATNSVSQVQGSGNNTNDIWNGTKVTNDTPYFQTATVEKTVTNAIEANGTNDVVIKAKGINSSARKGVIIDSDINLTGGSIGRFRNNGVDKGGVMHNGTLDFPFLQLQAQPTTSSVSSSTRGLIYVKSDAGVLDDEIHLILKKGDGTYVRFNVPFEERGTGAPTTGTYRVGNRVVNTAPAPGGYMGWVCVTAGTPGVWKGYGLIQA